MEFSIEENCLEVTKLLILCGATNNVGYNATGSGAGNGGLSRGIDVGTNKLKQEDIGGHVDVKLVKKTYEKMTSLLFNQNHSNTFATQLLNWGLQAQQDHASFVSVVVMAAMAITSVRGDAEEDATTSNLDDDFSKNQFIPKTMQRHSRRKRPNHESFSSIGSIDVGNGGEGVFSKIGGSVGLLLLIASFAGIEFGRRLRNMREFTVCLKHLMESSFGLSAAHKHGKVHHHQYRGLLQSEHEDKPLTMSARDVAMSRGDRGCTMKTNLKDEEDSNAIMMVSSRGSGDIKDAHGLEETVHQNSESHHHNENSSKSKNILCNSFTCLDEVIQEADTAWGDMHSPSHQSKRILWSPL